MTIVMAEQIVGHSLGACTHIAMYLRYARARTIAVLDLIGADRRVSPAAGFATSAVCMLMVAMFSLFDECQIVLSLYTCAVRYK